MVAMNSMTMTGREVGTQIERCSHIGHDCLGKGTGPNGGIVCHNGLKELAKRAKGADNQFEFNELAIRACIAAKLKHSNYENITSGGTCVGPLVWSRFYFWLVAEEHIKPIRFPKGVSVKDKICEYLGIEAQSDAAVARPQPGTVFDGLRTPKAGKARTGSNHLDRVIVDDAADRCEAREARVYSFLLEKWGPEEYNIVNHAKGVQVGSDFRIYSRRTGDLVAAVDAKSSPSLTPAQRKAALELYDRGIPYWMVGDDWKMLFSPNLIETVQRYGYAEAA